MQFISPSGLSQDHHMTSTMQHTFEIEVTDTFGGEANYSWVRRYTYKAKSKLGAIQQLAREHGAGWSKDFDSGDMARYNLKNSAICAFVSFKE